MTNWITMGAFIAFALYMWAWWWAIDTAIPGLKGSFWSVIMAAVPALWAPTIISDLTFQNQHLGICVMIAWFALPFMISIVFVLCRRTRPA